VHHYLFVGIETVSVEKIESWCRKTDAKEIWTCCHVSFI